MSKIKIPQPIWIESKGYWHLKVAKDGVRKSFYSSTPGRRGITECKRKADDWIYSSDQSDKIRFKDAWDEFLDHYALINKETSYNAIVARGKAHLLPALEKKVVKDIAKQDWQRIVFNAFQNGARSKATLKGIITSIRTFCKWASIKGYMLDSNVPIYFEYPTQAKIKPKRILQPDDLKKLFNDDLADNYYIYCFRFLALTGIRRGEICALQYPRDFDRTSITIRESISHEGIVTDGKTLNAERNILLSDLALEQINSHRRQSNIKKVPKYLFFDPTGDRISPRSLRNNWQKWREKNDIDITLHELRHTFISYSKLKTSISLDELKELYGHSKNMNTERVYVHEINKSPEELKEERKKKIEQSKEISGIFERLIK